MLVMPAPHCLLFLWRASHFCCLSSIHVINPSHYASSRDAQASNRFARCPTVRCSCISSCAYCRIVLSLRLLQSLGAQAVAEASLLLLRFPFSFHFIGSNMVDSAVSAATGVIAVAMSTATSAGTSLRPSPTSYVLGSLLSLTLTSVF